MTPRTLEEDLLREALVLEGCPEPEEWHGLVVGAVDETTAARLRQHARECAACAAEERLAALFEEPVAANDGEVQTLVRDLRSRRAPAVRRIDERRTAVRPAWRRLALAAAVTAAMVGAGLLLTRQAGPPPVGAPGDGSVLRSGVVELLAPLGEIDAPPAVLTWQEVPEAAGYRVAVTRVDGRMIWRSEVGAGEVRLPAEVLDELRPAVTYRWQVASLTASGAELGRSMEGEFQVRPGP